MSQEIPIIKTGQALRSLRDSGYTIEAALGEVIDNSIEAKANEVEIKLFQGVSDSGKKCVNKIAIIDDGMGMEENVLQYYPQIGYSTRYMSTTTIGKYGVGAKLAALNFAKKFEVWSRTKGEEVWNYVYFDLDEALMSDKTGQVFSIPLAKPKKIPKDLLEFSPKGSGTIVLWHTDRLEAGRYAIDFEELKHCLEKEMARIFRYFLDGGIKICIDNRLIQLYDPLFEMEKSYCDKIIKKFYEKEAKKNELFKAKVKFHYESKEIADEIIKIGGGAANLKVTLYPPEVLRSRGKGGDSFAKKLRVPENKGKISFVRFKREVSYTNVPKIFPTGVQDIDRFIGIEVSFSPELDEYFGVRNVKRGVEPHGELRKKIRDLLSKYLPIARKEIDRIWGKAARDEKKQNGEHSAVIEAAKATNATMPKSRTEDVPDKIEEEQIIDELAADVVGDNQESKEDYKEKIKESPFVIESVSFPGTQFIDIIHLSSKIIIRLNTRHRFYREIWEPLKRIADLDPGSITGENAKDSCRRAAESLTLLLLAYGKAESMHLKPDAQYRDLTNYWGQFLDTLMKNVKGVI